MDSFDEIQTESLDSMAIEDRANYWRIRYNLDERLEVWDVFHGVYCVCLPLFYVRKQKLF